LIKGDNNDRALIADVSSSKVKRSKKEVKRLEEPKVSDSPVISTVSSISENDKIVKNMISMDGIKSENDVEGATKMLSALLERDLSKKDLVKQDGKQAELFDGVKLPFEKYRGLKMQISEKEIRWDDKGVWRKLIASGEESIREKYHFDIPSGKSYIVHFV
jgi:hypothetical protein